jgi:hypothetical protein
MGLVMTGASADEVWPLVRDFHYSKRMPSAVRRCFAAREVGGLFGETGEPVAASVYGNPCNRNFNQDSLELLRLVRHEKYNAPISELVSFSLRWLKANTTTPFVLSYADTTQGHHGGIYQACGFVYIGATNSRLIGYTTEHGEFVHGRACNHRFGTMAIEALAKLRPGWSPTYGQPKHLYIFPLRQKWRTISRRYGWEAKPFPKPSSSAARLLDEQAPTCPSQARTLGAAPVFQGRAA